MYGHANSAISIHAPRVGSDLVQTQLEFLPVDFNPRSPCGERRDTIAAEILGQLFQSTLPVWGATGAAAGRQRRRSDFNPRSPCGERLRPRQRQPRCRNFNPRSPCGERRYHDDIMQAGMEFQSTLPVWGATAWDRMATALFEISIHAPRVGSDKGCTLIFGASKNFNPRSPCGERRIPVCLLPRLRIFQSTLPVWGATHTFGGVVARLVFQSTLPVWGATSWTKNKGEP